MHRLVSVGVIGFVLCVASGSLFVIAAPHQYLYNPAWQTKMALILLAGANMVLFYLTAAKRVKALGPDETPPVAARIFAGVSLACWLGVIAAGRVITAFRPPFHWCFWC
jgi:hypothetical protein